jgi:hypothetical protein
MSQITVRKLPKNVEQQIRQMAHENNTSINRTIIFLLKKSLGMTESVDKKRNLSDLAGTWSERDDQQFKENTKMFEKIDDEIWR